MIIGIGLDLASVDFWAEALQDPTTSVIEGTFTEHERADAARGPTPQAERLAARFAAKEAFIKALGGSRHGESPTVSRLDPRLIEVTLDAYGRPALKLHGLAQDVADTVGVRHIWVSLTHEATMTAATVILEG